MKFPGADELSPYEKETLEKMSKESLILLLQANTASWEASQKEVNNWKNKYSVLNELYDQLLEKRVER